MREEKNWWNEKSVTELARNGALYLISHILYECAEQGKSYVVMVEMGRHLG